MLQKMQKHWRAASVSAEIALIDKLFCIVEYSVLIFSMATVNGLLDCILIDYLL